jgi:predicted O-linked N-acetylglucosamine transferase (SPINDLY family)
MLRRLVKSIGAGRAAALNDAAVRRLRQQDFAGAERLLRRAIAIHPGHAPACNSLGMALCDQRRLDEGAAFFRRALDADPGYALARINLANALVVGNRLDEAVAHYTEVLRHDPDNAKARAGRLKPLLDLCDWHAAEAEVAFLVDRWRRDPEDPVLSALTPFASLLVPFPPEMRLKVARRHSGRIANKVVREPPLRRSPRPGQVKLRIGYAAATFHNHATAHLAAGLFERHDHSRFEVFAYSFGIDDASEYRRRLAAAFDRFVDVRDEPHRVTAQRIADDRVDILVDLHGHTDGGRPEVLALRPAPVQVGFLGYPGTTGAPFIDYLIADRVVAPRSDWEWFSEKIVWMPASYQVNDAGQRLADRTPSRAEFALPERGFVFCAFNKHYKIEREMFGLWLRLLALVPGSVLWLLGGPGEDRLRQAAARARVDPQRLVFAGKLPKPEHLARHRLADLFLDTRYVNAHTTASDALWAGLPVLTCPGPTFAGRVAASLLRAVGLPELVADDLPAYEARALDLARHPERLGELRARLAANRLRTPLFDTAGFTRALERAYETMCERHASGAPPAPFGVAQATGATG